MIYPKAGDQFPNQPDYPVEPVRRPAWIDRYRTAIVTLSTLGIALTSVVTLYVIDGRAVNQGTDHSAPSRLVQPGAYGLELVETKTAARDVRTGPCDSAGRSVEGSVTVKNNGQQHATYTVGGQIETATGETIGTWKAGPISLAKGRSATVPVTGSTEIWSTQTLRCTSPAAIRKAVW